MSTAERPYQPEQRLSGGTLKQWDFQQAAGGDRPVSLRTSLTAESLDFGRRMAAADFLRQVYDRYREHA